MSQNTEIQRIDALSTKDLRAWLKKNHKKEHKVAFIFHKRHTGKGAPTHREQIEEAICFGWIDTTLKRLDEDTYMRHFSKRTMNSSWSDNTIGYAKRLIKEGRMTEQGMHFYKLGIAKPTHDHGIPKDPPMPLELKAALRKNRQARKRFDAYPPSSKKSLYRWILKGKLAPTREKRVAHVVAQAGNNVRDIL